MRPAFASSRPINNDERIRVGLPRVALNGLMMYTFPMKRASKKPQLAGSFLVEALIAIAVLTIIAGSIVVSLSNQLNTAQSSRDTATATAFAQEGLEAARVIRNAGWDGLATGQHGVGWINGTWGFSGTSDSTSTYTRVVNVTQIDDHDRQVDSTVTWSPTQGRTRTITLTTILSDWRNAAQVDLGGGGLDGDWTAPGIISGQLDFGANFRALDVDVASTTLALAGFGTVSQTNELCMLDVSNPNSPVIHGCLNTGTGVNKVRIDLARKLVFMAYAGTSNQLQIADFSNIDAPTLKKQFTIAGNTQKGRSLDRVGNLIYLGTEGPATKEFYIYDVTDPMNPVLKGSLKIGNDINCVQVVGDYAYLASDVDGKELVIVNVHDPANPTLVSNTDVPGPQYAEVVWYDSATDRVYVGRQANATVNTPEVAVFDVSNKAAPQLIGSMEVPVNVNTLLSVGNLLFVMTLGDIEFRAYVATDPADLRYYGGIDFPIGDEPRGVKYLNNKFYVAVFNRYGLRIVTTF
jgi:type II secretory pathway pseudopilin PulG